MKERREEKMDDLARIKLALEDVGCDRYFQSFLDEKIHWQQFLLMNEDFLCSRLNIPAGTSHFYFFSFSLFLSFPFFLMFFFFFFLLCTEHATTISNHIKKLSQVYPLTGPLHWVAIEKLDPSQQVNVLISALKDDPSSLVSLIRGLERRYKTYLDFMSTRDHDAFNNKILIQLILEKMQQTDEQTLPAFLSLIKIVSRVGKNSNPILVCWMFLILCSALLLSFFSLQN
jgi:hypothetical protein